MLFVSTFLDLIYLYVGWVVEKQPFYFYLYGLFHYLLHTPLYKAYLLMYFHSQIYFYTVLLNIPYWYLLSCLLIFVWNRFRERKIIPQNQSASYNRLIADERKSRIFPNYLRQHLLAGNVRYNKFS